LKNSRNRVVGVDAAAFTGEDSSPVLAFGGGGGSIRSTYIRSIVLFHHPPFFNSLTHLTKKRFLFDKVCIFDFFQKIQKVLNIILGTFWEKVNR